jgi:hypothetical protein
VKLRPDGGRAGDLLAENLFAASCPVRIGIERGKSFDIDKLDPAIKTALETVPKDALALMAWKVASLARVVNGWSMNTDTMGVYGNYYLKRAIVTQLGLGANLPEEAIYPINLADDTGKPLDGANRYVLHCESSAIPPVNAFWSVTLYDAEGYQVPNNFKPVRRQQLDAVQIRPGRLPRPLFPERQPRPRQGSELAAGTERAVQPHEERRKARLEGRKTVR